MLSALRGLLKRWVMTTEVQTVDAEDDRAVAMSAVNYSSALKAAPRKRTGSSGATEPADLGKRPRTAPPTPSDSIANGLDSYPGGKLLAPEGPRDEALLSGLAEGAQRPSPAASAPAALDNVCQHAAASTGLGAQGGEPSSSGRGTGTQGRLLASSSTPVPGQRLAPNGSSHHHHRGHSSGGTSGGSIRGSHSRPHTPTLQHHHDPLEEEVFSPSFHLPGHDHDGAPSAAATTTASPSGAGAVGAPEATSAAATGHAHGAESGAAASGPRPASRRGQRAASQPGTVPGAQATRTVISVGGMLAAPVHSPASAVPARLDGGGGQQAQGLVSTQAQLQVLHAIDLNVVEGVVVDTDDDEGQVGQGGTPQPSSLQQVQGHQGVGTGGAAMAAGISMVSATVAAVTGELSSGVSDEEMSAEDDYGNDENAPAPPLVPPHPHASATAAAGHDMVLVASAPRALAVAVAAATSGAALPAPGGAMPDATPHGEGEEEEEEDEYLDFDPLLFIKQLPPLEACVPPHRPALLPRQTRACKRVTLVLDLDETLVHSSLETVDRSDFSFPVTFNGAEHMVFVRQRPHLRDFMERVASLFEVVVFTASQKIYAERLLDILDPGQNLVRHRIYRDSCVVVDGNYLKDLSILGRDLSQTIIVDNSPQAFGFQVDNGIPIDSWYDDDGDTELMKLLPFLESLCEVEDVRPRIRQQFRLRELIDRS